MNRKIMFFITIGLLPAFMEFTMVRSMDVSETQNALFSTFLGMLDQDSKKHEAAIQCYLDEVAKDLFPELEMWLQSTPPENATTINMEMRPIFDSSDTLHVVAIPLSNKLNSEDKAMNKIEKKAEKKPNCKSGVSPQTPIQKKSKQQNLASQYKCLAKFIDK
jgi:hypothetical protein